MKTRVDLFIAISGVSGWFGTNWRQFEQRRIASQAGLLFGNKRFMRLIRIVLGAVALTALACPAFPDATGSRQEALAALGSPDAAKRAEAVLWIGQHGSEADAAPLYERLHDDHPGVRHYAEQALWLVWSRSGDAAVDRLLGEGLEQMHERRYDEAIATFSRIIKLRPAFAEGWNKRATARYLAGDFRRSLADCAEVLKRNPRHFGALSGAGLNHLELREHRQALESFRRALDVNPNLEAVEGQVRRLERLLLDKTA
jgi:tetratricopeptide (TPR) repeat protein